MTNSETSSAYSIEQLYLPQSKLNLLGLRAAIANDRTVRGIEADRDVYAQKEGGLRRFVEDAWRYVDQSPFVGRSLRRRFDSTDSRQRRPPF
jgi:hypothetical protein